MNNIQYIFEKIFHPDIIEGNIVPFQQRNKKINYRITLLEEANKENEEEEEKDKSKGDDLLYKVSLEGFDKVYFAINFDKYKFIYGSKYDSEEYQKCLLIAEHIRKACDNIIWANFEGQDIILLVELKSKNNKNVPLKFKSTKLFLSYLNSLLAEFFDYKMTDFIIIPLLINTKPDRSLVENDCGGLKVYRKGIKNEDIYYIKRDFHEIINAQ